MNLLEGWKSEEKNFLNISNFRKNQYENTLPYLMEVCINFLSNQKDNYIKFKDCTINEVITYKGVYNSQYLEIAINVFDGEEKEKEFFKFFLPKLIDDDFFYLNGINYIPGFYCIDYPIICKKNSLKLSSLFNSITFDFNDDQAVFCQHNIPLSIFLQLFLDTEEDQKIFNKFPSFKNHLTYNKSDIESYFRSKYLGNNIEEIKKKIYNLFFDDYTKHLYQNCYDIKKFSMKKIIKKALKEYADGKSPEFIDLRNKRIIFLEYLLLPLFERIASFSLNLSKGFDNYEFSLDKYACIKYYLRSPDNSKQKKQKGIGGNFLYDTCNLYSGILKHKMSFVSPGIDNPPSEIKNIHPSHYKKICPITISSQTPGSLVSVIPGTKLDFFGRFEF
ncbi:MAG: hypothetical protein K9H48_07760 [Melioribacteraceae bacterium]|nr:hypothetical protein [Melioribacteraceae bacterium]